MSPSLRRRPTRRGSLSRWTIGIVPLAVATLLLATASAGPASSAPLPVIPTDRHTAITITGTTGAPTVYASDGFNRANSLLSASTTMLKGGPWTVWTGAWRINGSSLRVNSVAQGNISAQTGQINVRVIATMTLGATANAGLQLNDSGTRALSLLYTPAAGGTLQLSKYVPANVTVLKTTTGVGTFTNSTVVFSALTTATGLTATINGTNVFTYTYTAADLADVKQPANSFHGLWAESDSTTVFDDFRVESP